MMLYIAIAVHMCIHSNFKMIKKVVEVILLMLCVSQSSDSLCVSVDGTNPIPNCSLIVVIAKKDLSEKFIRVEIEANLETSCGVKPHAEATVDQGNGRITKVEATNSTAKVYTVLMCSYVVLMCSYTVLMCSYM